MFLEMNDGAAILLTFVALFITIGLGALFLFLIKRNMNKEKEESEVIVENAITKKAMEASIRSYIKKVDRFGAMTLMYVDVDGFGDLNEVFGREACDQILKEMATRILRALPYKASLCKYENDEFLIFIKDEDNKSRIERLANQINEILNNPYQVLVGESIRLTASIGVATYPVAGETFEDLYANLQLTTYVSKRDGGNKFTSFYATIKEEETDNMMYYQEVKRAILNKEFVLYYQPIVNLSEKVMNGAEALMRWNHPTKGVQAPATFLKVLEQSGDIKWVGEWGLESMIRIHNTFAEKFPTMPLRFSLNLSTKQLLDVNLANKFIDIMNKNNAKPEQYMLEISDFMMVERIAVIKTNIFKLRDFGFKIAVDGFELDGQSVQNIQRSPVDVIKLGRGFLKDIENNFMKERLLQILVKFANDNNKTLICEGIETAEVAKYVKEQDVFLGQGYFFAKPMSQEAFAEYLERHQYKVLLDDVSALEDNEALLQAMGEAEETYEYVEEEESPEDLLARTVYGSDDNN
ncbi:MAG: EAL domain-containing protein [Anaeroplasma sp.]